MACTDCEHCCCDKHAPRVNVATVVPTFTCIFCQLRAATERAERAERERDMFIAASRGEGWGDKPIPEDKAIADAFPTRTGRHDLCQEAARLVGAKRGKFELMALVNWLLADRDALRAAAAEREAEIERAKEGTTMGIPSNQSILATCNACGEPLLLQYLFCEDGCPCNSPRGVNFLAKPCVACGEECSRPGHRIGALFGEHFPGVIADIAGIVAEREACEADALRAAAAEREAEIERARVDGFWRGVAAERAVVADEKAARLREETRAFVDTRQDVRVVAIAAFGADKATREAASLRAALAPPAAGEAVTAPPGHEPTLGGVPVAAWHSAAVTPADGETVADHDGCHADDDGHCMWAYCPQIRDGYAAPNGDVIRVAGRKHRTCPLCAATRGEGEG